MIRSKPVRRGISFREKKKKYVTFDQVLQYVYVARFHSHLSCLPRLEIFRQHVPFVSRISICSSRIGSLDKVLRLHEIIVDRESKRVSLDRPRQVADTAFASEMAQSSKPTYKWGPFPPKAQYIAHAVGSSWSKMAR